MRPSSTDRNAAGAGRLARPLSVSILLASIFLSAAAAADWPDPFATGDTQKYPQPVPVTTVDRVAGLKPLPSMVAVAPAAAVIHAEGNQSVRIALLDVIRSDEIAGAKAPQGMEAVVLVTRWENVHPRKSVSRAQLESSGDRTAGAGALLGGAGKSGANDTVELDVAYEVRQPGLNLWLVAGGEMHALRVESKALPNGVGPDDAFTVAHFGEQREARLGWFVPRGSQDLELRFFDYDNGSVTLAVAGEAANAEKAPVLSPVDTAHLEELDLSVLGSTYSDHWGDTPATAGWRFLVVELLGKSLATQGNKPALVNADPTRYVWAIGDGGTLRYALPPASGTNIISFTPELPHRQRVAFPVPENAAAFRIGMRGRSGVTSLRATAAEPAPHGAALASANDAGALDLALLGLHWDGPALVAEFLASPLASGKGVELDPLQQLLLQAGGSEYRPDTTLTARLYGQPPSPFVLPPGTPVAFQLAYSLPASAVPSAVHYRGFSGESMLGIEASMLSGSRGTAAGLLAATAPPTIKAAATAAAPAAADVIPPPAPAAKPAAAAATAPPAPAAAAATTSAAPAAAPGAAPPPPPPQLMPVALPPFDAQHAVTEKEPDDSFEQATPLGTALTARGNLSATDRVDRFRFDVNGEPQLWTVEANGTGFGAIEVHGASGNRLVSVDARGKPQLRIDNLQLLPGRYWVSVTASSAGGDYTLRAVPLGRPERENEFEPNDEASQAQALRFGEPRHGLISAPADTDMYRFSLDADTHLALRLSPPKDLKLGMTIQGGGVHLTGNRLAAAGEPSVYDALLQAGDYTVAVQSVGGAASDVPYELRLDTLDPFDEAADLEPNDAPQQARPLEGVRHVTGAAKTFDDSDWFLLPAVTVPTAASVRFTGGTGLSLRLVEGGRIVSGDLTETARTDKDRSYTAALQPGVPAYFEVAYAGNYAIDFTLDPEPTTASVPAVGGLQLALKSKPAELAAYRPEGQQVPLEFSVTNAGSQPQQVELETASAAQGWHVTPAGNPVQVGAGQSATLNATLSADADLPAAERLPLYVRAQSADAASAALELPVQAECGSPPRSPERDMPLPAALLGGFDVAWAALGATPVGGDAQREALLFDGMTPVGQSYDMRKLPADITVRLAGGPVPVAGVTLFPTSASRSIGSVPFSVQTSNDGTSFNEVYRGVLDPAPREHAFAFAAPVPASHVRLHFENPTGLDSGLEAALAEFKVIAKPGATPFGAKLPNIADPALGGHLVWVSWPEAPTEVKAVLTEAAEKKTSNIDPLTPIEWVVGFQHERAARVTRLEWQDAPDSGNRRPQQVAVAASVEGPNGPWLPLADWALQRDADGLATLELGTPVWARYLRFSMPGDASGGRWQLAETLRVFEQAQGADYRSILAEWGPYRREAYYEMQASAQAPTAAAGANSGRDRALALANAAVSAGRVQAGTRDEWYRIKVPDGLERLELRFGGNGSSRLLPLLETADRKTIEMQEADDDAGQRVYYAPVQPGSEVWLKVAEAPRSIMVLWDNSGSTVQFHEGMYQAFARFADDIKPGHEVVNLMPLGETGVEPLLPDWSSNPVEIKAAIGKIDRGSGSSNAQSTLLAAMARFDEHSGNRAIILMTDAESGGGSLNSKLWQRFREIRPRIFALELQVEAQTAAVSSYQDLMQDWAAVNHGDYRVFRSQADLDHAFERAACLLRSPAEYSVSWRPAPGKGHLRVVWEQGKAMAGAALELVLDASGSMRSSKALVAGKLKMDVARAVVQEIIQSLPDETEAGLRIYGHRVREGTPGDCEDSELVAPVALLDRTLLSTAVSKVQALGTTPIAYSITQACADLARIAGPKLIVVITDGKEECKGDPEAAIAACRDAMPDLRMDIVGFALADAQDKQDMQRAAAKGGGRFFDAQDRAALSNAIEESLAMPFEVFDSHDAPIAEGLTGESGEALYKGNYTVAVHTASGDVTVRDVSIAEEKTTTVYLSREANGIGFRIEAAK